MIRCENCGHKLKEGQKICDICKKPVVSQNTEDIELEEQLAKSIAKIVENETADAQVYLKQIQGTLDMDNQRARQRSTDAKDVLGVSQRSSSGRSNTATSSRASQPKREVNSAPRRQTTQETSRRQTAYEQSGRNAQSQSAKKPQTGSRKKKGNGGKIAVIAVSVIVAVMLIVGLAFYTINRILAKAQDNFAYYNNIGIEYVQNGKYAEAIPYLEKALTYQESAGKINLRFSLYDCYAATGDTEKAVSMLYNILAIDPYRLEAIVYLENYYESAGVTEALIELYEKYKDTSAAVAVEKYYVEVPKISVESGDYSSDLEVKISSDYGFKIYYTIDGSDPTINSSAYSTPVEILEGTTVLKCIAVNEYNITSDIVSAEYNIEYKAPDNPSISPRSGSYETEQLIVIGNIPAGGKAYYTLDNTTPNKNSTLYEGPFDMPQGNNVLSVIVYDKNGLASKVVKRNYVLNVEDKVSQERALEILWDTMEYKNMVNSEHLSADGEPVNLILDEKKEIDGRTLWVFDIYVSTEHGDLKANYQMGVDSEDSYVYTVYENNGVYTLDEVIY